MIHQIYWPTALGNTLSVFFNTETNLIVVDLVAASEEGGNEVIRRNLDEVVLLSFLDE